MNQEIETQDNWQKKSFAAETPSRIMEDRKDLEVWAEFNAGDEKSFNYIFRTFTPHLVYYGNQITADQELVKDCIQNIFIHLRSKRGKLEMVSNIKSYLFKCLKREIILHLKKNINLIREEREGQFMVEVSFETKFIDAETELRQKKQLELALNKLSKRQRQAILFLYEDGFTYKEISELMDLKDPKYARKLVYRALHALRSNVNSKLV